MVARTTSFEETVSRLIHLDDETRAKIAKRSSPLDDLFYMGMLLKVNKVRDMIEIGTFLGQSACFLAPCITGTFYTININPREVAIAKETVASFGVRNVKFITGDSLKMLPEITARCSDSLDAVYIDGFHSYEYAMGEYKLVEPHLAAKERGVAFFDDASQPHPDGAHDGGVLRAVSEVGAERLLVLGNRVAIKAFGEFKYI